MSLFPSRSVLTASMFRFLSFILLPVVFAGQDKPAVSPDAATKTVTVRSPDEYAGESLVIERLDSVFAMNADGTGFRQKTIVAKIQSEAALKIASVVTMAFAGDSERVEFHYARSRHADGTVTETPLSGTMEEPAAVTREAPLYSDLKEMQLPIKNLKVGDTLEWEIRVVRTKAEAPGQFWGSDSFSDDGAVVKEESIELRVPEATTVWTNRKLNRYTKTMAPGGMAVYRWESSELVPNTGPAGEAAKKAKKTRLLTEDEELDATAGKLPSVAWTTFKNWAAVGAWYRGLEGNRAVPGEEIKAKVAELIAGKTTEEAKVRAVYAYVSTQIRYIGVDFGIGRTQPHEALEVLHNQYGDCKDKEVLLASMLAVLGEETDAALIGVGVRFNEEVPSPAVFNHVITRTHVAGKAVWLDSTEEIAPYEAMYSSLRDKTVLVVPDKDEAKIAKTPAGLPYVAHDTWSSKGSLDKDGVSDSHITLSLRGDNELILRTLVRQVAPAQYEEFMQRFVNSFGYGGTTSHTEISRPEDTDGPLTMDFDYHREKAGDWDNLRTVSQVLPVLLPEVNEKEPPVQSIELGMPHTESSRAEMKLPPGWVAELPEAVHAHSVYGTYDQTYQFDLGVLETRRELVMLREKVPASDWKTYKAWRDQVGADAFVPLHRSKAEMPMKILGDKPSEGTPFDMKFGDASAAALIQQAGGMVKDKAKADELLARAEALDPHARGLWAMRAYLAMMYGAPREGEEDLRKEMAAHPDEGATSYEILAQLQRMQHEQKELLVTLKSWVAADPENLKAQLQLAQTLTQESQYKEAIAPAQKALELMGPDDESRPQTEVLLGRAELHGGMVEEGVKTLVALLQAKSSEPNLSMMNNAAYELADADKELPLAEKQEREVLRSLDTWSQTWTMDMSSTNLRGATHLLEASWDTMGWILFREGKAAEAESYLQAAWMNSESEVDKEHLDQVRKALGHEEKKPPVPKGRFDMTITATAPHGRLSPPPLMLGPANGRKAYAEYRILVSSKSVELAVPTGEKTVPGIQEAFKNAKTEKYFPKGSESKLLWTGVVNCVETACMLVLEP